MALRNNYRLSVTCYKVNRLEWICYCLQLKNRDADHFWYSQSCLMVLNLIMGILGIFIDILQKGV